jgi:hypothetical protein
MPGSGVAAGMSAIVRVYGSGMPRVDERETELVRSMVFHVAW